ncbi:YjjW family glycine radical enzyme activase [Clostridium chrysemydis]|uniref:YjjW family glycine radical enzyme activase n=1 Tax=Clostridium chrysemydis TaxID=2665504 RepID=UPI003F32570B
MAVVNKIIPFSCVDGPGNRMVIFFQGCNFSCTYCHNPETINKCNNCGECVKGCPSGALKMASGKVSYDKEECIDCDRCIKVCKNLSSPKTKDYSVIELLEEIKKCRPFISGITVSGGECTLNKEFLVELFKKVKDLGLTLFVDTNGNIDLEKNKDLVDITDKFMLDIKSIDEEENITLTGASNKLPIKNLKYLLYLNKIFEVRTVVCNNLDSFKTIDETSKIIKDRCRYKIIKYREFGVREEGIKLHGEESPSLEFMEKLKDKAISNGCLDTIIT